VLSPRKCFRTTFGPKAAKVSPFRTCPKAAKAARKPSLTKLTRTIGYMLGSIWSSVWLATQPQPRWPTVIPEDWSVSSHLNNFFGLEGNSVLSENPEGNMVRSLHFTHLPRIYHTFREAREVRAKCGFGRTHILSLRTPRAGPGRATPRRAPPRRAAPRRQLT